MKTDLFEDFENLPKEVQKIITSFSEKAPDYDDCKAFVIELEKVGYTCDYGLDASPFNLHQIKKTMKLVTVHLTIGKSKKLITYTFKEQDFVRVEGDRLFIQNEERPLKMSEEQIRNLIFQVNWL